VDSTLLMRRLGKRCHTWKLCYLVLAFKFEAVWSFTDFGDWICEFRAYDRAAIKFRGVDADINFNLSDYEDDLKQVGLWCDLD
jgi:hypothetical protein